MRLYALVCACMRSYALVCACMRLYARHRETVMLWLRVKLHVIVLGIRHDVWDSHLSDFERFWPHKSIRNPMKTKNRGTNRPGTVGLAGLPGACLISGWTEVWAWLAGLLAGWRKNCLDALGLAGRLGTRLPGLERSNWPA